VEGTVVDAATSKPLPGARLRLELSPSEPVYTKTDTNGRFLFSNLPAGSYSLKTQNPGYLPSDQKFSVQAVSSINWPVSLTRAAIITGTVTNVDGNPVSGAILEALTPRPAQPGDATRFNVTLLPGTQTALVAGSDSTTDDRGRFRSLPLRPGSYYIMIKQRPNTRDLATYYPGTSDISSAKPVVLELGQVVTADIRTLDGAGATVAGRLILPSGAKVPAGASMSIQLTVPSNSFAFESVSVEGAGPHPFQLKGVSQGNYIATAIVTGPGESRMTRRPNLYGAVIRLQVSEKDINSLDIQLKELPPIPGVVSFAAGCPVVPVRFFMAGAEAYSNSDGKFELKDMRPDFTPFYASATGAYATSALLGDREILREGFEYPVPPGTTMRVFMDCPNKGGRQ
jgi:hypothetical protein